MAASPLKHAIRLGGCEMGLLLAIALILLLFGIIGGVTISKFLFLVLIVALIVAAFGWFSRTA
jgi:hypothetical protein